MIEKGVTLLNMEVVKVCALFSYLHKCNVYLQRTLGTALPGFERASLHETDMQHSLC